MRGAWVIVVVASAGCNSILGIEDFKLGDAGTTGSDASDAAPAYCVGPDGWRVCLPMAPTMPLEVTGGSVLDTDTGMPCLNAQPASWKEPQSDGTTRQPDACIIVASSITIGGIFARGSRPLVLVAADTITIGPNAFLDVSSGANGPGAGSRPACPGSASGQSGTGNQAGGGGAGGSFLTPGGDGGTSSSGSLGGRAASPAPLPTILTPGCSGGNGGASGGNPGGAAGIGGGAVYLLAGSRIQIDGYVNASGGGGRPGGSLTGGGGGGAGGMIAVHAPAIGGGGILVANGGGGASGAGGSALGTPGADPDPRLPFRGALGGSAQIGGRGGNGFAEGSPAERGADGSPATAAAGGGGGGGGGYIRASMQPGNVTASPPVQVAP